MGWRLAPQCFSCCAVCACLRSQRCDFLGDYMNVDVHWIWPQSLMCWALFSLQVQQRIARSGQAQSTVSMPIQTNVSLTMPFYSNPMMFSQNNTRSLQDTNQRHADSEFSQDGQLRWALPSQKPLHLEENKGKVIALSLGSTHPRSKIKEKNSNKGLKLGMNKFSSWLLLICCRMLLNQPMQTLVPTSNVTSQPSQCNMGISQSM